MTRWMSAQWIIILHCTLSFIFSDLQSQLIVLSSQIIWSERVDSVLAKIGGGGDFSALTAVLSSVENMLNVLADSVLHEQPPVRRKKLEHLVSTCG